MACPSSSPPAAAENRFYADEEAKSVLEELCGQFAAQRGIDPKPMSPCLAYALGCALHQRTPLNLVGRTNVDFIRMD